MIILDTNVVSELMRPVPDEAALRWLLTTPSEDLCTTTIAQAEILAGIALLPAGRRRDAFSLAAAEAFADFSAERILAFDELAATEYASIFAERRSSGRPMQPFDAQIAAIARSRGGVLATRNVRDFLDCGIALINPWAA